MLKAAAAVLGVKTLELPAVVAAAGSAFAVPMVASQAGLVTARLIAAGRRARSHRRASMHSGPAGYLLGLKKHLGRRGVSRGWWRTR